MSSHMKIDNADKLLDYMTAEKGLDYSAPIDIDKIIQELGISVKSEEAMSGQVGGISLLENGEIVITINPAENDYKPRERFTLAHEVAHYCLHLSPDRKSFLDTRKTMSRSGSYWDRYETEANTFAAELLMPKDLLLDEIERVIDGEDKPQIMSDLIDILSRKFNVSFQAMEYRLNKLGLI